MAAKYTLVIHAGCEGITPEYYGPEAEQEHLAFLRKSLAAGRRSWTTSERLAEKAVLLPWIRPAGPPSPLPPAGCSAAWPGRTKPTGWPCSARRAVGSSAGESGGIRIQ